jgi:superfamily II DNA/RNA helicase
LTFQDVGLDATLLRALDACGFTAPTEIQSKALPPALDGRDLLASAQTGTGKTAAFALPIIQRLLKKPVKRGHGPRALILTPTRELATQVTDVFTSLGKYAHIQQGTIVGGVSFGPQNRLLRSPLEVLVATPGRLIDHMDRGNIDFSRLEVLVLDEADRMLDMGFLKAVTQIIKATPSDRQTMLFSATLEGKILEVAKKYLRNPERVQLAAAKQRHESIDQWMHPVQDQSKKRAMLDHLLADPTMNQVVVFAGTKWRAKKLSTSLSKEGHSSAPLQGNMTQSARQRTMDQMRDGKVRILVATDVAARGLDVPGITHVINFDLPMTPEDYIHRIGRTGRNGASGIAISLVAPDERSKLGEIERLIGQSVEPRTVDGLTSAHDERATPVAKKRPQGRRNRSNSNNPNPGSGGRRRSPNRSGGRSAGH